SDYFRGIANCIATSGTSTLFWDDLWNGKIRSVSYPNLCSHAFDRDIFLANIHSQPFEDCFKLPLPYEAYVEFMQMKGELDSLSLRNQKGDD
uniref:Reverse transcriptase zinc-binding domain-containing protein n=1 Tax=Oryza brachyantha TaxID=4533 RepID=J3MDX2_ORYBR